MPIKMSVICFNLDQPKILSSGNGLNCLNLDSLISKVILGDFFIK